MEQWVCNDTLSKKKAREESARQRRGGVVGGGRARCRFWLIPGLGSLCAAQETSRLTL